jgi:hypothetical protein
MGGRYNELLTFLGCWMTTLNLVVDCGDTPKFKSDGGNTEVVTPWQ